jgi:hypothetical protein
LARVPVSRYLLVAASRDESGNFEIYEYASTEP